MAKKEKKNFDWDSLKDLDEDAIEENAREILSLMSLEEKADQMSGDCSLFPGMIGLMFRYNAEPVTAGKNERLGIPPIKFTDGPRGVALGNSTCFPVSMARAASWDTDLEERIGNAIGIEARVQKANFFGGICINLLRHPAWGRAQETYGEDPHLLGEMGAALMRGSQNHVMACAKHFAANSIENSRNKVNVTMSERILREVYLPHFHRCVKEGAASVMSAYNKVNGEYCGHNAHLLREILKGDWGFPGFVISDFVFGIYDGERAVRGGLDIEMPFDLHMNAGKLVKLVGAGKIQEELIDEAALRILRQKLRFNRDFDPELYTRDKVACQDHVKLALEAARKGTVLLKNENDILPLEKGEIDEIAVIGKLGDEPNTGDRGSSRVYPPYVVTPLEGIRKVAGNELDVYYDEGKNLEDAQELARGVDAVVLVVGYTHKDEGERVFFIGGDRDSLRLKTQDEELISLIAEVNSNCIVVLETGSAVVTEKWREEVPAILVAWYPGMEGGTALGEIVFGDVSPSGKLPLTFPKSEDQLPYFDNEIPSIEYGQFHGYWLTEKEGHEPAFSFGHGLSYTEFGYSNLKVDETEITKEGKIRASVEVKNVGDRRGEEIVQLYVGCEDSEVTRPPKELRGFDRIPLEPDESKTVSFELNAEDLAYYDVERENWTVEEGEYTVFVGPSTREDELLTGSIEIH